MSDEFCPRQIIFEIPGSPAVQVTATENAGAIDFIVDVLDNASSDADLRALFFDINEAKLLGMTITGGDGHLTEFRIQANNVIDLDDGANLNGRTKDKFDVGLEWGTPGGGTDNLNDPLHFTLSNDAGDLTLDDIAHMRFGAKQDSVGGTGGKDNGTSKLLTVAPAAPDANDDNYDIFEDNSDGLDSPSKTPEDFVMTVLDNDTDADGDELVITEIHEQPEHGTVTIADDGKSLIYTPELDFAGQVSFEYCISDGDGGQDSALVTLDIEAVADIPLLKIDAAATDVVNEILFTVTATQDDKDSSEYIDRIVTSVLPVGATLVPVSVNPGDEPDEIVEEFLLTLTPGQDYDFDLTFTTNSIETSNGDEETASETIDITYEFNSTTVDGQFSAVDQSIWSSGDDFEFVDDRFLGFDTGDFGGKIGDVLYAGFNAHILAGFQSTLTFEGGDIDAVADYDITVATNYNKTVDVLQIDTLALLESALFDTEGPSGSYELDFVYDLLLEAFAGVDLTVEVLGETFGLHEEAGFSVSEADSISLIDLTSDELATSFDFPDPFDDFSLAFAWPNITTNGSLPPNPGTSNGASNNFLELGVDLDGLIFSLLGIPESPLDPGRIDIGPFFADPTLLDFDITGGLNFLQEFALAMGDLVGTLTFENGTSQSFTLGDDLLIYDAALIDDGGDGDDIVEFTFTVGPEADLSNDTALGFNVGLHLEVLSVELGYEFSFLGVDFGDSTTLGPVYEDTFNFPVTDVSVFNETFALDFSNDNFTFGA